MTQVLCCYTWYIGICWDFDHFVRCLLPTSVLLDGDYFILCSRCCLPWTVCLYNVSKYRLCSRGGSRFKVRGGAHLKYLRRAEGGRANIFGVFRVKNHDFTPTNHIFSNCGGWREIFWGISCEKLRFYAKKSYFFQF